MLALQNKWHFPIFINTHYRGCTPGFVRTDKSMPRQKIPKMAYMIDLEESVPGMMEVIDYITIEDTGSFLKWTGEHEAW